MCPKLALVAMVTKCGLLHRTMKFGTLYYKKIGQTPYFYTKTFNKHRWRRAVVVNMLVSINEVALHRARLLLGWVTVC